MQTTRFSPKNNFLFLQTESGTRAHAPVPVIRRVKKQQPGFSSVSQSSADLKEVDVSPVSSDMTTPPRECLREQI